MRTLGIVSSIIVIISVFLPWIEITSTSTEISIETFNTRYITGFSNTYGVVGLALGIISVFMFYSERKLALIPGYTIVFIGLIYIFEILQRGETTSSSVGNYYSSISYITEIQIGMYLFLISGVFCIISGFKFLKIDSKIWTFS